VSNDSTSGRTTHAVLGGFGDRSASTRTECPSPRARAFGPLCSHRRAQATSPTTLPGDVESVSSSPTRPARGPRPGEGRPPICASTDSIFGRGFPVRSACKP
jgi:hypothetical protein